MGRAGRPKKQKAPLPDVVGAFLNKLSERGATASTREAYERDLTAVCCFLEKHGIDIETATTDDLKAYLAEFASRENVKRNGLIKKTACGSITRRLSALRQFFGFLASEGNRPDNPAVTIERPKDSRDGSGSFQEVS